jgi:hypothetical protein
LVTAVAGVPGIQHYDRAAFNHFLTQNHVDHTKNTTYKSIENNLQKLLPGEVMGGHVAYHENLDDFFHQKGIKSLLILRDPRDVVVSNLNWWQIHEDIDVWPLRFFRALPTLREKLNFLILGEEYSAIREMKNYEKLYFPNIVKRYGTFLPWLGSSNCLTTTFEELKQKLDQTLAKVYSWVWNGVKPNEKHLASMKRGMKPKHSKTYFKSLTCQWPLYFEDEHYERLRSIGGVALLNKLGYSLKAHYQ